MNERAEISAAHLARQAIAYLGQSSAAQAEHNRESTEHQHDPAFARCWAASRACRASASSHSH